MKHTNEAAFETAIESVLLADGYARVEAKGFDRERAIFADEALAFVRATQAKVWEKLEALHGEQADCFKAWWPRAPWFRKDRRAGAATGCPFRTPPNISPGTPNIRLGTPNIAPGSPNTVMVSVRSPRLPGPRSAYNPMKWKELFSISAKDAG